MKLTCSDTTASGARRLASSGLRNRGTAAERSAPIPPSPTIAGPVSSRSRKRFWAGTSSPSELARHILRARPDRVWHLAAEAGCRRRHRAGSLGLLSMRSGTRPSPPPILQTQKTQEGPPPGPSWVSLEGDSPRLPPPHRGLTRYAFSLSRGGGASSITRSRLTEVLDALKVEDRPADARLDSKARD